MSEDSLFEYPFIKHVEWKIKDFLNLSAKINYAIDSSYFPFCGSDWCIRIYPNGQDTPVYNSGGWISIFLRKAKSASKHSVAYRIGIIQSDDSEFKAINMKHVFPLKSDGHGIYKFIERSSLQISNNILSSDGTLTLFCTIRLKDHWFASSSVESASWYSETHGVKAAFHTPSSSDIPNLSKDFKKLYLSKRFTDLTIIVKSREFYAHKNILASRSAVFDSMFQHDTKEKQSGRVEIPDCDPDTFEDFLLFVYTGKFSSVTSSNAVSLYKTSEKYDVQELKKECIRVMTHTLTVDTFCDVHYLANMYNDCELLKATTDFFNNNTKSILMTSQWHTFIWENPLLGNELFLRTFNK